MNNNNNRSLHIFDIPTELLKQLEPIEKAPEAVLTEQATQVTANALERLQIQQEDTELTCRTCQLSFLSREEQRSHYNTDWHRYNIKRKLVLDAAPISFEEFERLLSDLTESISGSEEEEEEEGQEQDKINTLVSRQKEEQNEQQDSTSDQPIIASQLKRYSALSWFRHKENTSLHYGIYRHLLASSSLAALRKSEGKRYWTIFMLGGGHFAACVIDVNASISDVKFAEHKTIHRYTTRRKQGGSQSANDNARGKANSAGAQIRRYNEQMLQQEVRQTISQWREKIQASEFVFVHAPSNNRNVLFGYDGAILNADNTKSIPFVTRRPTLNELKRVYGELATVKVIEIDEESIQEQQRVMEEEKVKRQQSSVKKTQDQKAPTTQPEVVSVDPAVEKLINIVKQNKTAVTISYIEKHKDLPISGLLPKNLAREDLRHNPTLLHMVAAMGGAGDLVSELLRKYNADPTIVNNLGKTAYEVSKDKETRNAFRRCMCDLPDKWKWLEEARVPSPLTKEQEEEQIQKEKKRLEREQEKKRLLELERAKMEAKREAKEEQLRQQKQREQAKDKQPFASVQKTLGGSNSIMSDMANMSPEARMRLEREKRARAAEERMKRFASK
ncbi:hypothetical protein G6F62_008356 [Rhizopus arrhizus]|nr:hypothetical protein G6F24_011669 [Rhizopus arrhizus]KAG0781953.1 hypothetical protein G6F21_011375 [Rhizopus arrhizus]KAG0783348.1 hypothetical protein G6F22_008718 [Rhizopus arrhizus]KAG0809294.1 hypothetical protein G6F20_008892 [Rhizopus arrhizus]KAG0821791.1 hypothetical protein G6F19_011739 [Rhizopus arrhizus]